MIHRHNKDYNALENMTKRNTWAGIAVGVSVAGLGLAGAQAGGAFGGDEYNPEDYLIYKQLPDYPEAEGARGEWWNKLQQWGKEPGYGAISPEWDETWRQAKEKLTQYYWGGVGDTGLAGKVKASAARRNVSQSPALENTLGMMGMQEGQDVRNLAGTEAINKAQFAETGRQNWLNSIMNLSGLKPSYITSSGVSNGSTSYGAGSAISDILTGASGLTSTLAKNKQTEDFMTKYLEIMKGNTASDIGLSSNLGSAKSDDLLWQLQNLG